MRLPREGRLDNLAHSLVGWALGEAGLKRKTGLGVATLIVAANLPDIDVLGMLVGENLAFRRGITHGPLALLVMPPLLAAAMQAFDRWQAKRGTRPKDRPPVRFGWLFALAFIGVLSHPALDYLNVYGVRFLMPFSDRWFYGDTLFIIDVWLWLGLALGIGLSRWRQRHAKASPEAPALVSLVAVAVYIGAMGAGSVAAERTALEAVRKQGYGTPIEVVASPPPLNPFARQMFYDLGDQYGYGAVTFAPTRTVSIDAPFSTNMDDPAIAAAAARNEAAADYLYWSRLPFAEVADVAGGKRVALMDARFARPPSLKQFRVETLVPPR